jgi:hypothetical protein
LILSGAKTPSICSPDSKIGTERKSATAAIIMVGVVADMVGVVAAARFGARGFRGLWGHRKTASFAQLRLLAQNARPDLRLIGNKLFAKAHGIGRASVPGGLAALGRLAALGAGAIEACQQQPDRQCQRADKACCRHFCFLNSDLRFELSGLGPTNNFRQP